MKTSMKVFAAAISLLLSTGCSLFLGSTEPRRVYTVEVNPSTITIPVGGPAATVTAKVSRSLGAVAVEESATITWTTSNASVATVTETGKTTSISAVGKGSAIITASANGAEGHATVIVN